MSTTSSSPETPLPEWCHGLIDDAAIFPPGNADLTDAASAYIDRDLPLVGSFVLRDTDLPKLAVARGVTMPVSVVVTGGAGQIAGPAQYCAKEEGYELAGIEIALRDLDDLAGNARRVAVAVDAARSSGDLDFEVPIYVELPDSGSFGRWGDPIEVLVENDFRLKLRTGGVDADAFPTPQKLADWLDLIQAHAIPFKCTAGLHHALRSTSIEGFEQHGFLNVLVATKRMFDGATVPEVAEILENRNGEALAAEDLSGARRWFVSFGSCSIEEPLADLRELGLVASGG